jgi:transposase
MQGQLVKGPKPRAIELSEEERARLTELARRQKTANAVARRARIVLAAADGLGNAAIYRSLGVGKSTVEKWRARFARHRLDGLLDEPRSGAPRKITDTQVEEVLRTLEATPRRSGTLDRRSMARESAFRRTRSGAYGAPSVCSHIGARRFGFPPILSSSRRCATSSAST